MDCNHTRTLLSAYADGELGPPDATELAEHLSGCPSCSAELAAQAELSETLRRQTSYHAAPAGLAARIRRALPKEPVPARGDRSWPWVWLTGGATAAMLAAIVLSVGLYRTQPDETDPLVEEIVASHMRSLMANHLADVVSTDRHTVKPWFNGRLDFSPPVSDFARQGYALVGGRLDYLDHRPVAALIYRRNQHPINLFLWPAANARDQAPTAFTKRGYNVLQWARAGTAYWAVSDITPADLAAFRDLLATAE